MDRSRQLSACEDRLGYRFKDQALLDQALTHPSYANDHRLGRRENGRLQLLGDAVVKLAVADLLHRADPDGSEGSKSKKLSYLVSSNSLIHAARTLEIPASLLLGAGARTEGGPAAAKRVSSRAFEAVLGAVFMDGGLEPALEVVRQLLGPGLLAKAAIERLDYRGDLQRWLQARGLPPPKYLEPNDDVSASEPKVFLSRCVVDGETIAVGSAPTKKEARRIAAGLALTVLQNRERGTAS